MKRYNLPKIGSEGKLSECDPENAAQKETVEQRRQEYREFIEKAEEDFAFRSERIPATAVYEWNRERGEYCASNGQHLSVEEGVFKALAPGIVLKGTDVTVDAVVEDGSVKHEDKRVSVEVLDVYMRLRRLGYVLRRKADAEGALAMYDMKRPGKDAKTVTLAVCRDIPGGGPLSSMQGDADEMVLACVKQGHVMYLNMSVFNDIDPASSCDSL